MKLIHSVRTPIELALKGLVTAALLVGLHSPALAQDQCDLTSECQSLFGSQATDCANSWSSSSVCMCGGQRCDELDDGGDTDPGSDNRYSVPGYVQAEDYARFSDTTAQNLGGEYRQDAVDIQTTTDNGGEYNVGWIETNEWLEYDLSVQTAGAYEAKIRVASNPGGGLFTLEIDGSQRAGGIQVSATGGWQSWQTLTVDLGQLSAGNHTLRVQVQSGGFNLNWFELAQAGGDNGGGSEMIGHFDASQDLLLANYDLRPDPDDLHTVAAFATMLHDSRFQNVNYHAVAGAYGTQGGTYIEAEHLFNLAFGNNRWSDAHNNRSGALNEVYGIASSVLSSGGDIWIQEAGQSDFSADLVRRIQQDMPGINTQQRIHLVQHSNWNQDQTTNADLTYVQNQTDYRKIDDGNSVGNGSPGFNSKDTSQWSRVLNDSQVGDIWAEAKRVADYSIEHHPGWKNPTIRDGGMDFSDTVEDTWIFGFNHLHNHQSFFDEFL
ncbi:carbohydrate-binding protein [Marinimicrobium agarilyticum]|uniref:carbohydrate-binding protein n=1 Tax=Marinimicrobium agarilyticum TaxID=306546 RepID=UPI0004242879|nr:carbohydrate-binding protein [Marinimicrobium agarilyticum]